MRNPRLASRYAKSLVDLAVEKNQLEAVYSDMQLLKAICQSNPDVVALLKSPVIKADKKRIILEAIFAGKISDMTTGFIRLLVSKGREAVLSEIADAVESQYNAINHIVKVKLSVATPIDSEMVQLITDKVAASSGKTVVINTVVNPDLIGGFVLETGNELFDASILRDLQDIKKQFLKNIYVSEIR
jgi:F-type H+-transporting ATPase subunit delta